MSNTGTARTKAVIAEQRKFSALLKMLRAGRQSPSQAAGVFQQNRPEADMTGSGLVPCQSDPESHFACPQVLGVNVLSVSGRAALAEGFHSAAQVTH